MHTRLSAEGKRLVQLPFGDGDEILVFADRPSLASFSLLSCRHTTVLAFLPLISFIRALKFLTIAPLHIPCQEKEVKLMEEKEMRRALGELQGKNGRVQTTVRLS